MKNYFSPLLPTFRHYVSDLKESQAKN